MIITWHIIGPNINNCLYISCNALDIAIEYWLFYCLPARVVVIGTPMHRIKSIASSHLRYKISMHVLRLKQLTVPIDQPDGKLPAPSTYIPWCTTITGYQINSTNSNIQQPTTTDRRQTSKLQPGMSQQTWVKTTTNRTYAWQFKYANTMPTVLCTNIGLICGYTAGIHFCLKTEKLHVMCHMKFVTIHWNFMSTNTYNIHR